MEEVINGWIDCDDNNSEVLNETNQSYTPVTNGNYAVIVTGASCSDTSDCVPVSEVGIKEFNSLEVSLYPNLNTGSFYLRTSEKDIKITIYAIDGKVIVSDLLVNNSNEQINLNHVEPGLYFVKISNDSGHKIIHLEIK